MAMQFEGFGNKEMSSGAGIFHPKHNPTMLPKMAGSKADDPPKRTPSVTKRSFLKKVGD